MFNTVIARVKSPGQQMHFTAGLPLRFLADTNDPNAYVCPPGHPWYACPDSHLDYFLNGVQVGTQQADDPSVAIHGWEWDLPAGLAVGDYVLTVRFTPHNLTTNAGGTPVDGVVPVTFHVDPPPTHANTITLTNNIVLSGSTPLNWTDATVVGNGFSVTAAPGYSGAVTIQHSFVTGFATMDALGIDVTTSGAVTITDNVLEATAPPHVVGTGTVPPMVIGNEFRANNRVDYVLNDPDKTPVLDVTSSVGGTFQANNVAGGIVRLSGAHWQIGGLTPGVGNILHGPRTVLQVYGTDYTIQGNELYPDYFWEQSQGFTLQGSTMTDRLLIEHNVIRGGSWPLQSLGGEIRYNLIFDEGGHNASRGMKTGTRLHHNVILSNAPPTTGYQGLLWTYLGESGIQIVNNTIDAAPIAQYNQPAVLMGSGSVYTRFSNNLVRGFVDVASTPSGTIAGDPGGLQSADYNDFWNPAVTTTPHYSTGLVTPGGHDLAADPKLAGTPDVPTTIDDGRVWLHQLTIPQILASYRATYTPVAGSPLIDAGDPVDGPGIDIGAVGAGACDPADQFGTLGAAPCVSGPPTGGTSTASGSCAHPCIWLDAARLGMLRQKAAANDPWWVKVKAHADDLLTYTVPPYDRDACADKEICFTYQGTGQNAWLDAIETLGLAYQVTKDPRYSAKVAQVVDVMIAAGTTPVQVDSGFPSRSVVLGFTLAYDWCYDQLGSARRAAMWPIGNGEFDWAKASAFDFSASTSGIGNYLGGHVLGLGAWGLATAGDNSRSAEITTYVRGKFDNLIAPAFASGLFQSCYPVEGYGYGVNNFVRLFEYMLAVKTATGEDLIGAKPVTCARALLYALRPNRWQVDDEADWPGSVTGIITDPTLLPMLATLMPTGTPEAAYVQWEYQHLAAPPPGTVPADASRDTQLFLWSDPSLPATDYRTVLPLSRYSPGDEHHIDRTSWADDACWSSLRGMNPSIGHAMRGAGHVEFQCGNDRLLVNAGQCKGPSCVDGDPQVFDRRSKAANTLDYQNLWSADYAGGQGDWGVNTTLAHAETDTYGFECADLTSAYINGPSGPGTGPGAGLKKFTRCKVDLLNGTIVLSDHIEAGEASDRHVLLFHIPPAASAPALAGSAVTTTLGATTLQIRVLNPAAAIDLQRDTVSDTNLTPMTYRVEVSDTSGGTVFDVITVLSAYAAGGMPPTITSLGASSVQVGARTVTFGAGASSVAVK